MMGRRASDEYRILRRRQDDLRAVLDQRMRRGSNGTPRQLVQVYDGGSMPSATGKFFATHPATITGDECEGCPATITADTSFTYYVLFIGSRVPQVGDVYVARFLDYRWVAESGGKVTCRGKGNTLQLYLTGCSLFPVPGASVDFILGGTTVYSTTTDSSGYATYSEPAPGTYTINWSYAGFSGSQSGTITAACNSVTATDRLSNGASGYNSCCSGCLTPLPDSIYLTDANGTWRLGFISGQGWAVNYTTTFDGNTYKISYGLQCDGTLLLTWLNTPSAADYSCSDPVFGLPNLADGEVATNRYDSVTIPTQNLCSSPFAPFSGTFPATGDNCGSVNPVAGAFSYSA